MEHVDLLIHSASELVTCGAGAPKRHRDLADLRIIPNGAVAVVDGRIAAIGETRDIRSRFEGRETIDAVGRSVCPGFVDCHTHLVFAGSRLHEFELRLRGASYMEILNAGGGIVHTMLATREARLEELIGLGMQRLDEILSLGTTTVEIKTGYGLDIDGELKMLHVIEELGRRHPVTVVPTFLGAHAFPPEYVSRREEYVDLIVEEMLPRAAAWYATSGFPDRAIPFFCDVFCEEGVFGLSDSERILRAGSRHGLLPKIHADEFKSVGGVPLACDLGAASADHLDHTSPADIARLADSDVIGVLLPMVNLSLGSHEFAPARSMVDAGVALAVATDLNPGSAPCPSMPLTMGVAARYGRLLPSEALTAATVNAAFAVGLGERAGSIEVGKWADLLILSGPDCRQLSHQLGGNPVEVVIKAGRVVVEGGRRSGPSG